MRTQWVIKKSLFVSLLTAFLVIVIASLSLSVVRRVLLFEMQNWRALFIVFLMINFLVVAFFYMPRFVFFRDSGLVLQRIGGVKEFPFEKIKSVSSYKLALSNLGFRLFASGGLFGFFGLFRNRYLGNYFLYAGALKEAVFLEMVDGKKFVIQVENVDTLIEALKEKVEVIACK